MDFVIDKIVDIEKEAQKIKDEAESKKNNLPKEIEAELLLMEQQFNRDFEGKINAYSQKELKAEQEEINVINKLHNEKMSEFINEFNKHSNEYENKLFDSITSLSLN